MPESSRGFENRMPGLAKNQFVIAPDFLGCGESSYFPEGHIRDFTEA